MAEQLERAIQIATCEVIKRQNLEMELLRAKTDVVHSEYKYSLALKTIVKAEKEIENLKKQQHPEPSGPTEYTNLAKDIRDLILFNKDTNKKDWALIGLQCAFEALYRLVKERSTPTESDKEKIETIRESLKELLDD
jgi:replicative DNA helicase